MKYLENNRIGIEYNDLVPEIMSLHSYKHYQRTNQLSTDCVGGNGREVHIYFDSLPVKYQGLIKAKYVDLHEHIAQQPILQWLKDMPDYKARNFYATHLLADGTTLPIAHQQKYIRQAEWLNMIILALDDKRELKRRLNIPIEKFWQYCISLHQNDKPINPGLPTDLHLFRRLVKKYRDGGYKELISKKFGNQNTRKVSAKIKDLIIGLGIIAYKPTPAEITRLFAKWCTGSIQIIDEQTGEVFTAKDIFPDGKIQALGESTIKYYLNMPGTIQAIQAGQMSKLQHKSLYHPAVKRLSAMYAFSKITMDDRDLRFKDHSGERVVKSYQIMDVASEAIIGKSFSRDKNVALLRAALLDMMQLIICNDWGMPAEIEMERHLTQNLQGKYVENADGNDEWVNDILTQGIVFANVRVCLGGNAREKRAEHIFRQKIYSVDNKRPGFLGRFYAKQVTNRLNQDQKEVRYSYEQIVQNELDDIDTWNNQLHPKQNLYPGLTRWEVLEQCQNPNLTVYPVQSLMPYIGYKVESSLNHGYIQAMYNSYRFHDIKMFDKLIHDKIIAYYIPSENGIEKVFVYQAPYGAAPTASNLKFIGEAKKVEPFQEAIAEQTERDMKLAAEQWAYQKAYDTYIKNKRASFINVGVINDDVVKQYREKPKVMEVVREKPNDNEEKEWFIPVENMTAREMAMRDI